MNKTITIACDHAGYDLKNALKKEILKPTKIYVKEVLNLIKNNLLLDSKKISIHKKFVQDRVKVSYVGGLVILVSCIFFWNENITFV